MPPRALTVVLVLIVGCDDPTAGDGGALGDGAPDGSSSGDGAVGDAGETGDGPDLVHGSITLVLSEVLVTEDRLCDLDGDGLMDNAIAGLGSPSAELFAAALNQILAGFTEVHNERVLLHIPEVDDVTVPSATSAVLLSLSSRDADHPRDPEDDFSGDEEFYAMPVSLDECVEPTNVLENVRIEEGELSTDPGNFIIPTLGTARGFSLWGTIAPGAAPPSWKGAPIWSPGTWRAPRALPVSGLPTH